MKPPYEITPLILSLINSISEKLGEVNANYLVHQSPQLRKQNRIRTIQSSLQIEGNTLSVDQITAIMENKKVLGPANEIKEVLNAIKTYDQLNKLNFKSEKSFLKAHKELMDGLVSSAGKYRSKSVGIVKGKQLTHLAPSHNQVPSLMNKLFDYLKKSDDLVLIKSCVFHYELEFIHPFLDGNGRMGRLWQTLILRDKYPVFEYLPFETLVNATQKDYYKALSRSNKSGKSTFFIEYMLNVIDISLNDLMNYKGKIMKDIDRLNYFVSTGVKEFSRKDYMKVFKDISTATASRDLRKGVELSLIKKIGEKNNSYYVVVEFPL